MVVNFQTYEQFHAKQGIGSTKIRVHNLIKYWSEASLYKYGTNPDVLIFQKVYLTLDYRLPELFKGIKILDTCDPDWKDSPDIFVKETLDLMDAVVTSSDKMTEYLQQMTDTPVVTIKDRFDLEEFPEPKLHIGPITTAGWFGYAHNAELIQFAIPSLEKRGIGLTVVSNDDPACWRWAENAEQYQKKCKFIKYQDDLQARTALQEADVAVMIPGFRPFDRFKSENKTVVAQLCGLPVVKDAEELDLMNDPQARNDHINKIYAELRKEYDCRKSIEEYKQLIERINNGRVSK